jgi:O-antigen ligase
VVVKDAFHARAFIVFFAKPDGHPIIPTFCIGGPNLEATWLTLASIFFIGSRLFLPYALAVLSISMLYASRVGVIIVAFAMLAAAVRAAAHRRSLRAASGTRRRGLRFNVPLMAAVVAVASMAAVRYADGLSYVAQRFQNIGDEPGSMGRLTLWEGGAAVFAAHPYGVGLGNSVPQLERALGVDVPEDNLHNLYLQHLVEAGLPGLMAYVLFAAMTWRRLAARRFQDHMLIYVVCYLVIAMIQFSGADPLLWFIYGLQGGVDLSREAYDAP